MLSFIKSCTIAYIKKMVSLGLTKPLVLICARDIKLHPQCKNDKTLITILALNPARFRGDLDCLAATGKYRILKMSFHWQARLHNWFYEGNKKSYSELPPDLLESRRQQYQFFLKKFLPDLFSYLKVDLVIGAAIHYVQDHDIATVSHQLGIPSVILHREGNLASSEIRKVYEQRCRLYGKLHATHLVVQNDVQKNISVHTGYVSEKNCSSVGILRMDEFLKKIELQSHRNAKGIQASSKKVTFFSFGPSTGILGTKPNNWPDNEELYLYKFCQKTHCTIAQFAKNTPEIDVIIKPKWGKSWVDHIHRVTQSANINLNEIRNLQIQPDAHVHQLLFESNVVIGFGSTTLLEASILGLPVIMPLYEEAAEEKWRGWIQYGDWLNCFDIANSPDHLLELIQYRLAHPEITSEMMDARKKAFETFVSPLDRSATQKLVDLFDRFALAA